MESAHLTFGRPLATGHNPALDGLRGLAILMVEARCVVVAAGQDALAVGRERHRIARTVNPDDTQIPGASPPKSLVMALRRRSPACAAKVATDNDAMKALQRGFA